jgi:ribose-phosphate pyrophosphokinase
VLVVVVAVPEHDRVLHPDQPLMDRPPGRLEGSQRQHGAGPIFPAATHGVLSGKAVQYLEDAPIQEVVVTNTVPIPEEKHIGKLKVLSIAPLIADALRAVFEDTSVSEILHGENQ